MTRCFCDRCGKDITDRDILFRVDFDYFGSKEQYELAVCKAYDICDECFFKIIKDIEG